MQQIFFHLLWKFRLYVDRITPKHSNFQFAFGFRVVDVIEDHVANHSDKPFFIYLPFQDVHGPLQVPKQYEEMYPEINNTDRRVFSGKPNKYQYNPYIGYLKIIFLKIFP